ncbi:DUF1376 domain-containing protein [Hymenobacter metallilatus]|uniref:DUF1376 domain-containing protein n=1 Tax=Hymenobacter metallilatus TaxID=2493666 RepID=A0A428JCW1_9BACT|nr:DUF1376 domain-containing protein [Hymenobacter metallilatus]RSK29871.1 DUF1376 domain-containing protein [Hymenobacter metallilatus]
MKSPAFQFYTGDFLSSPDVQMMDAREVGAYCLLLFNAWQGEQPGHLPNSEDKMRRLARLSVEEWQTSREIILGKFPIAADGATRYNPRMVAEAEKQWVFRNKQAGNGAKGGRPKKNPTESQKNPSLSTENPSLSNQNPEHNPKKALQFSSSISSSLHTPPTPATEGGVLAEGSKKNEGPAASEEYPAEGSPASASHTKGPAADVATPVEFRPDPEWAAPMRLVADQLATYFGLSNAQQDARMRLTRFCRIQFEQGQGQLLTDQFAAYRAYKKLRDERLHGWKSYIGTEAQRFADGAWNEKDWAAALTEARKTTSTHGNSRFTDAAGNGSASDSSRRHHIPSRINYQNDAA